MISQYCHVTFLVGISLWMTLPDSYTFSVGGRRGLKKNRVSPHFQLALKAQSNNSLPLCLCCLPFSQPPLVCQLRVVQKGRHGGDLGCSVFRYRYFASFRTQFLIWPVVSVLITVKKHSFYFFLLGCLFPLSAHSTQSPGLLLAYPTVYFNFTFSSVMFSQFNFICWAFTVQCCNVPGTGPYS